MKNDRKHYESYREQTRVKHSILEKYLPAYLNILKRRNGRLVYIDGFAGPGSYTCAESGESFEGSPIRALRTIASTNASAVTACFIEDDPVLASQLQKAVEEFCEENPHVERPHLAVGKFAAELGRILDGVDERGASLAPTFLFVDPCGVSGVDFLTLQRFMENHACELFVFFNLDGVRRIVGLGDTSGDTLADLLGSEERATDLKAQVASRDSPLAREECIVAFYLSLLRDEIGAEFLTAFRVEKEDRAVTSHYLIHATRHRLGFRIMKDVMWSVGKTAEGRGGLALEQASVTKGPRLITPEWEAVRQGILKELESGRRRVHHFYAALTERPENRLCEAAYRKALLELEADGLVQVLNKDGLSPAPASGRRKGTLGKDYFVTRGEP